MTPIVFCCYIIVCLNSNFEFFRPLLSLSIGLFRGCRDEAFEIRVLEGRPRWDAPAWFQVNHLLKQVYRLIVKILAKLSDVFCSVTVPLWECHLHFGKICETLPSFFRWCAKCSENPKDLPNLRVTCKQWLLVSQLVEDGPDGPHIDGRRVNLGAEQDLRRAIPKCDDFMRVSFQWQAHRTCKAKVRNFDLRDLRVH